MILLKPTLADLLYLTHHARDDEVEQYEALLGRPWDAEAVAADHFARSGVSLALFSKQTGRPVVAGGWCPIVDGVWAGWMVGTMPGWDAEWRAITLACNSVMRRMLSSGARRLQLLVLESRTKTCEWYERGLRMQREGEMKAYGAEGQSAVMYARTQGARHG
jgi:hypothetical protein